MGYFWLLASCASNIYLFFRYYYHGIIVFGNNICLYFKKPFMSFIKHRFCKIYCVVRWSYLFHEHYIHCLLFGIHLLANHAKQWNKKHTHTKYDHKYIQSVSISLSCVCMFILSVFSMRNIGICAIQVNWTVSNKQFYYLNAYTHP